MQKCSGAVTYVQYTVTYSTPTVYSTVRKVTSPYSVQYKRSNFTVTTVLYEIPVAVQGDY